MNMQAKPEDCWADAGRQPRIAIIGAGMSGIAAVVKLRKAGYTDLTVLDVAGSALTHGKTRLGERAERVHWIESDVVTFSPQREYALWHDRAALTF